MVGEVCTAAAATDAAACTPCTSRLRHKLTPTTSPPRARGAAAGPPRGPQTPPETSPPQTSPETGPESPRLGASHAAVDSHAVGTRWSLPDEAAAPTTRTPAHAAPSPRRTAGPTATRCPAAAVAAAVSPPADAHVGDGASPTAAAAPAQTASAAATDAAAEPAGGPVAPAAAGSGPLRGATPQHHDASPAVAARRRTAAATATAAATEAGAGPTSAAPARGTAPAAPLGGSSAAGRPSPSPPP